MKVHAFFEERLHKGICQIIKKSAIVFGLSLTPTISTSASCYSGVASERLANFCALNRIEGAIVDVRSLYLIDYRLKLEGSDLGLGLPVYVDKSILSQNVHPIVSYSGNINGGNPPEPLVLGDLTFQGDEELYRKEGFVIGLGSGFVGKYIYGDRRYLSYSADASYSYSPDHKIGITSISSNVCSLNHFVNFWYIDVCANAVNVRKELIDSIDRNFSISSAKLLSTGERAYSQLNFGINRYFSESYIQDQFILGIDTLRGSGVYSKFNFLLGEPVENKLATTFSVNTQLSIPIENKPFTISGSISNAEGGLLMGVDQSEITYSVTVSYPIGNNLIASIGYQHTDNSIDYFDIDTPTFSIQLKSFEF